MVYQPIFQGNEYHREPTVYLNVSWPKRSSMVQHLSTEDLERMREFAETPRYKRSPDTLVPSEEN